MKITVMVRTLNEVEHIERFCRWYDFADKILVADGGSTDGTIELAQKYDYVEIRKFLDKIELPDGSFMNPESRHANFLIDWAKEDGAEWVILDDCDCVPNSHLYKAARDILREAQLPVVNVRRLHLWMKTQYFPKMGKAASLWAWQPNKVHIYGEDRKDLGIQIRGIPDESGRVDVEPPYCLLHDIYPDEATVERKLSRYEAWGMPQDNPLDWQYAPAEPLPEWAI